MNKEDHLCIKNSLGKQSLLCSCHEHVSLCSSRKCPHPHWRDWNFLGVGLRGVLDRIPTVREVWILCRNTHWIQMHVYVYTVWYFSFKSILIVRLCYLWLFVVNWLCLNGGNKATDSHPLSTQKVLEKSLNQIQKRWILKLPNKQVQAPFLWNTNRAQVYHEHRFECWNDTGCSLQYIQQGIWWQLLHSSIFWSSTCLIMYWFSKAKLDDDQNFRIHSGSRNGTVVRALVSYQSGLVSILVQCHK